MKARFNVKPEVNKAGESPIRVSLFIRGTRMMQSIGINVDKTKFDLKAQALPKGYKNAAGQTGAEINNRMGKIVAHFSDYELTLSEPPTVQQLSTELKKVLYASDVHLANLHKGDKDLDSLKQKTEEAKEEALEKTAPSAYSYMEQYRKERAREVSWTLETAKMNKSFQKHLETFNKTAPLSYFDKEGLAAFVDYLRFKCNMEDSSVRKQYKNLVAFLNWCQAKGYAVLPDVNLYHPVFKVPAKPVIFLNHDELMRLYKYEVPKSGEKVTIHDMDGNEQEEIVKEPGALAKTRDLFCFCAFTSLRYSDMANVHRYDIKDGVLTVTTQKTNAALNIKLNSYAQAILDKYKDQQFPGDLALPVISNQKMNAYLKDICKLCDINDPIRITGFRNGRRYDIVRPKYSEMSTHAGRKTFICFMLSIGVSPQVVMKFTGHADYKSMKPYIDIADKAKTDAMSAMEKALNKKPKTAKKK